MTLINHSFYYLIEYILKLRQIPLFYREQPSDCRQEYRAGIGTEASQ